MLIDHFPGISFVVLLGRHRNTWRIASFSLSKSSLFAPLSAFIIWAAVVLFCRLPLRSLFQNLSVRMYLDLHAVTNHTNVQRHSVECDLSIMHLSALKIAVVKKFPKKYDTRFYGSQAVSLAVVAWKPWQTMVWCRFWWLGRTHVSVGGQATINPKCLKCTVTHHVALAKKHLIGLSSVRTSRPFWSWTQMVGVWQ